MSDRREILIKPIERLNGWAKVLALFIPMAIAGLIAVVTTREKVSALEAQAATHATRENVAIQYDAILRELRTMNERLARLENDRE